MHSRPVRFALAFVVAAGTVAWPRGAASQAAVYRVVRTPVCDLETREGNDALWSMLNTGATGFEQAPPWASLVRAAAAAPEDVAPALTLARCYYTFYRAFSRRPHFDDVERLLDGAAVVVRRERDAAEAVPAPPPGLPVKPGTPIRITTAPAPTRRQAPVYPKAAARTHVTGMVFLDVTIDQSGNVRETRVVGSIPELDKAAQDAVKKWKFEPTLVGARRATVIAPVSVKFGSAERTPADAIDEARFQYARRNFRVAEALLLQASTAVRAERLAPPPPLTVLDRLMRAQVYKTSSGLRAPTIVQQPEPKYTSEAMQNKIQGDVELLALVLEDGTVGALRVSKSLDSQFGLDDQAVKAASTWRFRPAMAPDNTPVPVIVTLVLTFRLH